MFTRKQRTRHKRKKDPALKCFRIQHAAKCAQITEAKRRRAFAKARAPGFVKRAGKICEFAFNQAAE